MRHLVKNTNIPLSLSKLTPPTNVSSINPAHYKGKDVKRQLMLDQYGKCVYFECRLNGDYGHVDHYRPKAGYTVPPSNVLKTPGYYWLAYEWSNLFLSCSTCNTSYKQNHFALEDESQRDIANQNISKEVPLLINPYEEDPKLHLKFHQYILAPILIDGKESKKGRYTIDVLQLNTRTSLVEYRRDIWEKFNRWKDIKRVAKELIDSKKDVERGEILFRMAQQEMDRMKAYDSEYSSMFL